MTIPVEERILARKDLFVQMWRSGQRSESIAAMFLISTTTVNAWGKKLGLPRRYLGAHYKPFLEGDQTEAELRFARIAIHERKCAIKRNWDVETERLRRAVRPTEYRVTRLTWSGDGFRDAGEPAHNPMLDSKMMNRLMVQSGNTRQSHSGFYKESA